MSIHNSATVHRVLCASLKHRLIHCLCKAMLTSECVLHAINCRALPGMLHFSPVGAKEGLLAEEDGWIDG